MGENPAEHEGGGILAAETEWVKEWLGRYASAMREVALLRIRADNLRDRAMSLASSHIDGMPRAPGFGGDKYGGIIGEADLLENEAAEKEQKALTLYREIDNKIRQIGGTHGAERRFILQARYLDGLEWRDVTYLLFGDDKDFLEKEDTMQKRAFKIHAAALKDLSAILVSEKQGQENEQDQ